MKIPTVPWGTQTRQACSKLNSKGQIPEGLLRDHIERSWQRCVGQGLDPSRLSPLDPVGGAELKEAQERNLALLSEARPLMESLHEQISGSGSMVILTVPAGLIIHSLGDPEFIYKAQRVALKPGVSGSKHAFAEVLDYARRTGVTIYTVGVAVPRHPPEAGIVLDQLAHQTGGLSYRIDRAIELGPIYTTIERELRAQYLVAYQSSNPEGDAFRPIELEVKRPGAEVNAAAGYYP